MELSIHYINGQWKHPNDETTLTPCVMLREDWRIVEICSAYETTIRGMTHTD